jgi:hypothetical protein
MLDFKFHLGVEVDIRFMRRSLFKSLESREEEVEKFGSLIHISYKVSVQEFLVTVVKMLSAIPKLHCLVLLLSLMIIKEALDDIID